MINAPLPDLCGEHWPKPVPPQTHRLVANVDATFEQNVFNLAQRQRIADVHHHSEANDLGRCLEVLERIFHSETLDGILPTLNAVSSDNAVCTCASTRPLRLPPITDTRLSATRSSDPRCTPSAGLRRRGACEARPLNRRTLNTNGDTTDPWRRHHRHPYDWRRYRLDHRLRNRP